jgi:hypothetical protein
MKQLPEQVRIKISGVRGRNVYQLTTRRQLVTGLGNSLDIVIQQRFVNPTSPYRVRADNALLELAAGGNYELLIPASGTSPSERVRIHFDTKPTLVGGIHGAEQGPAQYELTRDSSGWQAKIELNETLHRRDVPFIVGHELDEIAIIVRANPPDKAAILAEARASLFKASSTAFLPPQVTAHSSAAARELCALWEDYQQPPRGTDSYGIKKREARLERMLEAMGLRESVHIFDKLRVLRAEGAPDTLLRRIGIPEALRNYMGSAGFHSLQTKLPTLKSIVDEDLISHLMIPLDPGRRLFLRGGINGGHYDRILHDFVNNHPIYVIVKEAEKVVKGVVCRKYSQYRWQGSGPKPKAHDSRYPKPNDAIAGTYHPSFQLAKKRGIPLPKTTFSYLQDFLLAADEAWHYWYNVHATLTHIGTKIEFTIFATRAGIQITGSFHRISSSSFRLQTVYVEASWF